MFGIFVYKSVFGMSWIGSAISALGGLMSSGASSAGALMSYNDQKKLVKQQQNFQERMSNTAHQREVRDLRKANLNPILSANSGASTPSGSMANLVNPLASTSKDINAARIIGAQIKETLASARASEAQADKANMDTAATAQSIAIRKPEEDYATNWLGKWLRRISYGAGDVGGSAKALSEPFKPRVDVNFNKNSKRLPKNTRVAFANKPNIKE